MHVLTRNFLLLDFFFFCWFACFNPLPLLLLLMLRLLFHLVRLWTLKNMCSSYNSGHICCSQNHRVSYVLFSIIFFYNGLSLNIHLYTRTICRFVRFENCFVKIARAHIERTCRQASDAWAQKVIFFFLLLFVSSSLFCFVYWFIACSFHLLWTNHTITCVLMDLFRSPSLSLAFWLYSLPNKWPITHYL